MKTTQKYLLNVILLCMLLIGVVLMPTKAYASSDSDFVVENGVLKEYKGNDADIVIPEGVTLINVDAFGYGDEDMQYIKSITLPSTLSEVDSGIGFAYYFNAFWGPNLQNIYVNKDNPYFSSVDGILYDKNQMTLIRYPRGKYKMASIPQTVKNIYKGAFSGCYIKDFKMPNTITHIEQGGFAYINQVNPNNPKDNSDSLLSVIMPDSVRKIEEGAFYNAGIANIVLSKNLTSLPEYIFADCTNHMNVFIPKSIKKIGYGAFQGVASKTTTIKGYKNSYAEKYAKENGIKFKAIKNMDFTSLLKKVKIASSLTLRKNASFDIKVTLPNDLNAEDVMITYKSSDKKIVTVSKKGKATAKNKKGVANITITVKDNYGNKKSLTTKITVK